MEAEVIEEALRASGLTRRDLAEHLGVTFWTVRHRLTKGYRWTMAELVDLEDFTGQEIVRHVLAAARTPAA